MTIVAEVYDWAYPLTERSSTEYLVLHHAAISSASPQAIHNMHRYTNGWNGIAYHYYIRKDGTIYRGRPEKTIGAHSEGHNYNSIGMCFEGNFEVEAMGKAQMVAGAQLVDDIRRRYTGIKVVEHRDENATACPGKNFPFEEIISGELLGNEGEEEIDLTKAEIQKMIDDSVTSGVNALNSTVNLAIQKAVEQAKEPVYAAIEDVPDWGCESVEKLMDMGYILGDTVGLNINNTMLRLVVLMDRAGLFDKDDAKPDDAKPVAEA